MVLLNGMAVSWCANKQGGVSQLIMEAEFVATSEVAREAHRPAADTDRGRHGAGCSHASACRHPGCHQPDEGETSTKKAKHIDVRHKFVMDYAQRDVIRAQHVCSMLILADLMTKAMDAFKLATLRGLMILA